LFCFRSHWQHHNLDWFLFSRKADDAATPLSSDTHFPRGGGSNLAPIEYKATIKRSEPENLFSSKKPEATKPAEPKKKLIRGKALKSSGAKRLQAKKKDDRLRSQGDEDGANLFGNDHLLADRLPKSVEPLRFKKVRMGMLVEQKNTNHYKGA
jgi:hypothetical protein